MAGRDLRGLTDGTGAGDRPPFCRTLVGVDPFAAITPEDLKARLDSVDAPEVLDVREPWEHALGALPGARLIPLDQLEARMGELDPGREVVVYCHHGIRSAEATRFLRRQGFAAARNLAGGIERWSLEVDPTVPRY